MEEKRDTIKVTRRAVNTSDRHRWTGQHGTSVFLDIGVLERVGTSILSFRKGGKKRQINTKKEGEGSEIEGSGRLGGLCNYRAHCVCFLVFNISKLTLYFVDSKYKVAINFKTSCFIFYQEKKFINPTDTMLIR